MPSQFGFEYREIEIKNPGEPTLTGWHILSKQKKSKGLVVQLHGNAENISTHFFSVAWLANQGFDVFVFDYRGFGASEGRESVSGAISDARRAIKFASMQLANGKVILYGQSIGGAFAGYIAAEPDIKAQLKGVILESAFSSYRSIVRDKLQGTWLTYPLAYPLSWLFSDAYAPIKSIANISPLPVLLLTSEQDSVVEAYHTKKLFAAAREPKELFVTKVAGHIAAQADEPSRKKIVNFLESNLR